MMRQTHAAGYTLTEMIVVLVILGLVAGGVAVLGTAAYGAMHKTRFEAECAEIQSAFVDLRNQALMSGSPYGAYAQILEDKIVLTHYRGDNGAKVTRTLPLRRFASKTGGIGRSVSSICPLPRRVPSAAAPPSP